MSKRDNFYNQITDDSGVTWPTDKVERKEQAINLFGATAMGALDTVISNRKTGDEEIDKRVREACASVLYWTFVKLDQFPGANVNIELESFEEDDGSVEKLGKINDEELRLMFFEWLEKYCDSVTEDELINC